MENHHHHHHHHHHHRHHRHLFANGIQATYAFFIATEAIVSALLVFAGIRYRSIALLASSAYGICTILFLILTIYAYALIGSGEYHDFDHHFKKRTARLSVNVSVIMIICAGAVAGYGIPHFFNPSALYGSGILRTAVLAASVQAVLTLGLFLMKEKSRFTKSACQHMLTGTLVSSLAAFGGVMAELKENYMLDPLCGMVIAIVLIYSAYGILNDYLKINTRL